MQENFFVNTDDNIGISNKQEFASPFVQSPIENTAPPPDLHVHRFNDLDSNLIEETAYREVKDETFQLEYRINQLEDNLKNIAKQIIAAKEINDFQKIDILTIKKHQDELELNRLYKKYSEQGFSARLSGGITNLITPRPKKNTDTADKVLEFISEKILSKLSKKFNSCRTLKLALSKLDNINKNVDELVSMTIPYGEGPSKYERLSDYLSRANSIQYKISKEIL